jgi:hypothetical protein
LTAIRLIPGGSGYFTCIQNMTLITTKLKSGGLHEKHVVGNLESWNPPQHLPLDPGKPRKTCVEEDLIRFLAVHLIEIFQLQAAQSVLIVATQMMLEMPVWEFCCYYNFSSPT